MKIFVLLKIPVALIFLSVFFACGKNTVQQYAPRNPALERAHKDSLVKVISGMYIGKTSCADCEWINYTIMLASSMNYSAKSVYKGKDVPPFQSKGKWRMVGDSIIALENTSDVPSYLQIINKDSLHMLDASMKRLTGPLESMFVLKRGDEDADTTNSSGIQNTPYVLEVLNDTKVSKKDYANEFPYLGFAINKGSVTGFSGCNRLNGEIKIAGNNISFLNLVLTRMTCPGDGEANFMSALKNTKTYKIENGKIHLMNGAKTLAIFGKKRSEFQSK
ncbi:MAG: META domain-containing protein [bacterium]